jgi:predicted nucleic acid-binding protein
MPRLVIDASLAAAWCFPDERTDYANGVLQAVSDSSEGIAPRLWAYEVRNSILVGLRRGRIARTDAEEFLDSLAALNINLVDPISYDAVFELAELNGLTVYDAAYLDIAVRQGAQLASLDGALQRAATKAGISLFKLTA